MDARIDAIAACAAVLLFAGCLVKPSYIPDELEPGWVCSSRTMSVADLSRAQSRPDTKAWKTNPPLTVEHFDIDLAKSGLKPKAFDTSGIKRG